MSRPKSKRIVFVCTGNTCRSPMAEILLRHKLVGLGVTNVKVLSAGLQTRKGDKINTYSQQVLQENAISCEEFRSTQLTDKILKEAYAIVCMTEQQKEFVMDMRWNALRKAGEEEIENNVYCFSEISGYEIRDPYGKGYDCYQYVFGLLDAGMSALIEKFELIAKPKKAVSGGKKRGRKKKQ